MSSELWRLNARTAVDRLRRGEIAATELIDAAATRIEHRAPSADANPYLVLAAVLAGIHHGITHEIDPGPATTGNSYDKHEPSLPATWTAFWKTPARSATNCWPACLWS